MENGFFARNRVGIKVEISLEEEILRDVWFPATIVEDLGNNLFLVEYNCSGINDDSELQRVNIDHLHIRPSVPQIRVTNFGLLEKVDAFYDFGWCSGVITKKLADSRYVVYFKHTNKMREFSHLELRPHVEWKDDKWCTTCQVPVSNDAEDDGLRETVFLNLTNPIEDTTTSIDKRTYSVTTSMKRSKPTNLGSNDKLIKPCKKFKSVTASYDLSLLNGGTSEEVSNLPVGQTVDKTRKLFRGKSTPAKQDQSVELKRPMVTSARKKGKLSADSRSLKALFKAAGDSTLTTPNIVKEKRVTKNVPLPVVIGLQCKAMAVSQSKKSKQLTSKSPQNVGEAETPQSIVPLAPKTTGNQDKETDGDMSTKRKSGRTSQRQPTNRKTSLALDHSVKKLPNRRRIKLTLQQEKSNKPVKGKRGRRRMISLNIECSPQDLQDSSKQKDNGNSDIDVEKSLDTLSEDQPLSTWFLATLESAGKKPPENFKFPPSTTKNNDQKPTFEKRSSLWETIEPMEAFCLIPQNPHFHPLDNLKESARERHAIHKMVDFSDVFEETFRLRFYHPRTQIEDQLEILVELETHGFDVRLLRNRLMKMLSCKDKREGFETMSQRSKDNLENERVKVQERNKVIELIDNQVDGLLQKRDELVKENEESELTIVALEEEVDGFEEAKRECVREFDELATAPF